MSKQVTLFSTWGLQEKNTQPSPQDNPPPTTDPFDCDDGDFGLTEQDLDELCRAEGNVSNAHCSKTNGFFHVGPSHAFLNSSIVEEGIPGFDEEAGQLWIYPTNYPLRDYQYNIVHKALFTNTLVCLPTGLGKTFIAAVVMYNFYRWYPNGKIVFLAPTKPLVAQQIEACHSVVGIPQEHTSEMTGHQSPKMRVLLWQQKRVFFLTPQVMQNDLMKGTCPAIDVCCVVFDEAHKALGNHAYCQVVKELSKSKVRFRVLALSATPGNDLKAVQQVVSNLQIGHIELRSEDSIDIQRYVNERKVEKIVVPLDGEIIDVKKSFVTILSGVLNRLVRYGVFYQTSPDKLTKYQLLQSREQFRAAGPPAGVLPGAVEGDFALAISLYHAYELLVQHGMRSFYQFLVTTFAAGGTQSRAKGEILRSSQYRGIMSSLGERVAASKARESQMNGPSFPRRGGCGKTEGAVAEGEFFYSHPKLRRLEDVVLDHFRQFQSDSSAHTRVMIFSQYRDSVQEIADMLDRHTPLVRVMSFVGHSTGKSSTKGLSQREQTEIVRRFREGGYNTLVSTCVGEEGLDIGDVDLIVCFDAPKSPIRLVQRMGRTGRKRKGRIVMILAEGKEDQGYNKSQSNKKSIHRAIFNSCKSLTLYQYCHRMVPKHIHPQVHKMHMSVEEFVSSKDTKRAVKVVKSGSSVLKQALGVRSMAQGKKVKRGTYLSDQELTCWSEGLSLSDQEFTAIEKSVHNCFTPSPFLCMSENKTLSCNMNTSLNASRTTACFALSLDKWVSHQLIRMPPKVIEHSQTSENFMSTLEFIDLTRTSEGMGQCYDLEMSTYLHREDIKTATDLTKLGGSSEEGRLPSSSPSTSSPPPRKKGTKRKQVITDSDEDDFVIEEKCNSPSSINHTTSITRHPKTVCVADKEHSTGKGSVADSDRQAPPTIDGSSHISLTQSGHAVPRAPSEDDLDWLDNLEPSQVYSASTSLAKTPSAIQNHEKQTVDLSSMSFCEADFDFKTPFLPVSRSRLRPSKCSTPASLIGTHSPTSTGTKGCSLFDNLPAEAIFDDFSTSLLDEHHSVHNSNNIVTTEFKLPSVRRDHSRTDTLQAKAYSDTATSTVTQSDKHVTSNTGKSDVIVLSDSDEAALGDVRVIEESDFEDQSCETSSDYSPLGETAPRGDREGLIDSCLTRTPLRAKSKDDSSVRITRKRRVRNRNAFCFQFDLANESTTDLGFPETGPLIDRGLVQPSTPPYEEYDDNDSFLGVVKKCCKRPLKNRNAFLQSPDTPGTSTISPRSKGNTPVINSDVTPKISRCKKRPKVTFECDSSEDEFDLGPKRKVIKRTLNRNQVHSETHTRHNDKERPSEFIEEEAEVSDDVQCGSDTEELSDEYEDSFINDNSMLTQISPSQRVAAEKTPKKISNSKANASSLYLRSLMSPEDHLFTGRRRGGGTRYRMVLSQRHELLNHYMTKAGFKVDQGRGSNKRFKGHGESERGVESSDSEAEEVTGLEEWEESSHQLDESVSSPLPVKRRRAAFLSDSEPSFMEESEHSVTGSVGDSGLSHGGVNSEEVVISPSLLASVKVGPTPARFSLGMDDWIDWSDLTD